MTTQPDLFINVHKGLRRALSESCVALGRGDADARATLAEVLHFVRHHGENEDLLLLPALERRAPALVERIAAAHAELERELGSLIAELEVAPIDALYQRTCAFTARYFEHMRDEEQLEPQLRAGLSSDEQVGFGRESVARTAPGDQRMMLKWMLPAMPRAEVDAFLAKLPAALADELRPLARP